MLGGSMNSKGSCDPLFGFKEDASPSCGVKRGSTTNGETTFLNLNFALKDPGTRALPSLCPWKEHPLLRRRSYGTPKFCDSSIPKTNEDLPPRSDLPCSRKEERRQGGMTNSGQTRCVKATTPANGQIGTGKNTCFTHFRLKSFFQRSLEAAVGLPRHTGEGTAFSSKPKSGLTGP
jgi:hypothetical protein